ncbi:MAG: phosphoglycerate mutase (2,3-diphosphoglycerate-independent) [Alphaproteobacteria bacterium CG11_big_fil_rev_8_21_14_0_20_39_49]|nr:MAG: phosphoglycerate mutase (2,3-diphosphoglycerate-independent) [Alphaproteobacteria bacterium CG11_big_fil_rev_8_21_14_0_20_39_49]
MTKDKRPKPVVLCILDGWGEGEATSDNAITSANTPFWDKLVASCPKSSLNTSGLSVGLPEGQMGNSEVGHMNIGGGRIVMQSLPRIDKAFADGELENDKQLNKFIESVKEKSGDVHIMGLMSPGGVHSHQMHIAGLAKIISKKGVAVKIHAFLDGRDVPPASAIEYLKNFNKEIAGFKAQVVSVCGRYYAMDRDNRRDRVKLAYDAMAKAQATKAASLEDAIEENYKKDVYDEFIKPIVLNGYEGMKDGDGLFMANFRSDRARQILNAFVTPDFDGFDRGGLIDFAGRIGMVEYSSELTKYVDILFKPIELKNNLGQVIADNNMTQLRIAETEKYAHVTFFFNSGNEEKYKGEERIMVPSPNVGTYDMKPEMSAVEVTDKLVDAVNSGKFDLIVVNYANTDMVGHTGSYDAAVKAVETIDGCLERLVNAVENARGSILITADHGNSEQMKDDKTGQPHTSHTTNPVPLIMAGYGADKYKLKNGRLCDIAPTILNIMGIGQPEDMTGEVLFK